MKFTMSKDGTKRTNVKVTLRYSRDDIELIKAAAKKQYGDNWRGWLEAHAALGIEGDLSNYVNGGQ